MTTEIQKQEKILALVQKESNLIEAFIPIQDKLFLFAPEDIQGWQEEKKEAFLRKTMAKIAHDEKLAECFNTPQGKMSIMEAVQKSCSTGLEIGGKHAYLVPQKVNGNLTVRYSMRASGYYALLAGGSRPIFSDLRWSLVYEEDAKLNEKINDGYIKNGHPYKSVVDPATGEIFHNVPMVESRGKVIGCWVQIIKKNGQKEAIYFTLEKINQWRAQSKNSRDDSPWKKWPDEMAEQACIRHACERYEQAREILAASIYDDETIEEETTTEALSRVLEPDEF